MGTRIEDLPIEISQGELETRYAEWGDMAVRHARVPAGTDFAPVLAGLPNAAARARTGASCSRARSD